MLPNTAGSKTAATSTSTANAPATATSSPQAQGALRLGCVAASLGGPRAMAHRAMAHRAMQNFQARPLPQGPWFRAHSLDPLSSMFALPTDQGHQTAAADPRALTLTKRPGAGGTAEVFVAARIGPDGFSQMTAVLARKIVVAGTPAGVVGTGPDRGQQRWHFGRARFGHRHRGRARQRTHQGLGAEKPLLEPMAAQHSVHSRRRRTSPHRPAQLRRSHPRVHHRWSLLRTAHSGQRTNIGLHGRRPTRRGSARPQSRALKGVVVAVPVVTMIYADTVGMSVDETRARAIPLTTTVPRCASLTSIFHQPRGG